MASQRRRTKTPTRRVVFGVAFAVFLLAGASSASASNWSVPLAAGGAGEATARALPPDPTGAAAACSGLVGGTVKVTWNAVTLATSYSISESTTSASGGYSVVASSVTGTSWTSPALSAGNYWFEVAAGIGIHWLGPNSSPTGESTIAVLSLICSQP
jgi:hypothetical protein